MRGSVRKHWMAGYVANRIDSIDIGSLLCINRNEPSLIDDNTCGFCVNKITIWDTSYSGENHVKILDDFAFAVFKFDSQFFFICVYGYHFCIEKNMLILLFNSGSKWLHDVSIRFRDQRIQDFDNRHSGAEFVIDGCQFKSDNPTSNNQQSFRNLFKG